MSYIQNDESGALTGQMTRLLRDESADNASLLLELVEGGGANKRVLGYLFGLAVFHYQPETAARALRLLQRHASPETGRQAEKLRSGASYYYNEAEYLGKLHQAEFDLFDFLLAYKMCNWHRVGQGRNAYFVVSHQTLNLSHFPGKVLTPALETLDFIRYLALPAHKDFDLEASFSHLAPLPLESVFIENMKLLEFPVVLLKHPRLRTLSIKRGAHRPRQPMQVPDGGPYGSEVLEKLIVDGYPIVGENRLGPFPKLREAVLPRCSLRHLDGLSASLRLEHLNARFNQLETLPDFLSDCTELRTLDFSGNPLRQIQLDLTKLTKLEDLEIRVQNRPPSLR